MQEVLAAHIDFSHLRSWVICQILRRQLVQAVIELELRDHEQTLLNGELFHLFPLGELATSDCGRHHSVASTALLFFAEQGKLISYERVEREGLNWDLGLWQHVKHVELIRHRALLSNWQNLEPSKALSFLKHFNQIVPLLT